MSLQFVMCFGRSLHQDDADRIDLELDTWIQLWQIVLDHCRDFLEPDQRVC